MPITQLPVPSPADLALIERCDSRVRVRRLLELAVVRHACAALIAGGCTIAVDDGDDGTLTYHTNVDAIVDAAFAVDDRILMVNHTTTGVNGWVRLVFGNSGWDVINDHTVNLEDLLAPTLAYAESLSAWG